VNGAVGERRCFIRDSPRIWQGHRFVEGTLVTSSMSIKRKHEAPEGPSTSADKRGLGRDARDNACILAEEAPACEAERTLALRKET
jgi:hypothetical protein